MLFRSFSIVSVLLHFQWYLISGITPSVKDDGTFKTASCWQIVADFNKTSQESTNFKLTRLSLASVQCIMQFPEALNFEFKGPWTHPSSLELILFMTFYSNTKTKVCIKNFNHKMKQALSNSALTPTQPHPPAPTCTQPKYFLTHPNPPKIMHHSPPFIPSHLNYFPTKSHPHKIMSK